MSKSPPVANGDNQPHGSDGPVVGRDRDHLNRWPFAREIYGIATTGPNDWSVRVGVYGEWGTGKTSVLKFIASMAEPAGHIVIWFDPWQHSTKAELWRAFVLTVFNQLESKLGHVPGADQARRKAWMEKAKGVVGAVTGLVNDTAGKAVDAGLELVKKHFAFTQDDLKSLQAILGDKRVIVLIDDLDRTAPELVPEILFALKELMDIPGFSFICAFDPVVVGEVLGRFHPGFGDGLKFLDKIIDYPRWLPPPSLESLTKLAVADATDSCPFVPTKAIADAIPLLPANPRAVRQFIRILALLKPHVQRHYDHELRWSAIIAANILKVRHPRIAHELLSDTGFWDSVGMIGLEHHGHDEEGKVREAIEAQIKKTCDAIGIKLERSQQSEVSAAMTALKSQMGLFGGLHGESVSYQLNIAEAPAAVTWKEFDTLIEAWKTSQSAVSVTTWIGKHAGTVQRTELEVYREVLQAALQRYAEALSKADNVFVDAEKTPLIAEVNSQFALLETLVFDLGALSRATRQFGNSDLEALVDRFVSLAISRMPVHSQFQSRNEAFLLRLFAEWGSDIMPLIRILNPYSGLRFRGHDGESAGELQEKLCGVALPQLARLLIASFRDEGSVERLVRKEDDTLASRGIISDVNGPLWCELRSEVFQVLSEASSNRVIQENAYELMHWFVLVREGHAPGDRQSLEKLFSDQTLFDAIWKAATATSLGSRAVYRLRDLPRVLKTMGVSVSLPPWWPEKMAELIVPAPTGAAHGTTVPANASEEGEP